MPKYDRAANQPPDHILKRLAKFFFGMGLQQAGTACRVDLSRRSSKSGVGSVSEAWCPAILYSAGTEPIPTTTGRYSARPYCDRILVTNESGSVSKRPNRELEHNKFSLRSLPTGV